ncbi:MAG TPA: hypothetical protein PLV82_03455, partial [bacterium]|nr:hypothetical protein [bacterium]
AVSLNIQGAEKHYSKIIEKALFYLDKADEKCKELKDQCPTETKDEINFIKDIITALPQTKTTSASQ